MTRSHLSNLLGCIALFLSACPDPGDPPLAETDTTDASSGDESVGTSSTSAADSTGLDTGSEGADSTGEAPPMDAQVELLRRLPGLWVAPVTSMTSVGNFPIMAMDMRPADDRTIFSRVDLDADNNLRFAFVIEELEGEPTLIFRNGGDFLGFFRDTRSALVEHDAEADTWRFCAITGGCAYVDVEVSLPDDDILVVSASVLGRSHMHWEGQRVEERPLEGDFPYDESPGVIDDPFPPLPTLNATLSWGEPLTEPTEAWIILTTTACGLIPGSCSPSRFIRGIAPQGATSIVLELEQIHAGDYLASAVLDRNGNLAASLFPDSGDLVSIPNQALTVAERGESNAALVLLVEL